MNVINQMADTPSMREHSENHKATNVKYDRITMKALVNIGCFPPPNYANLYSQDRKIRDLKANYPLGQYCDVNYAIIALAGVIFASLACLSLFFALNSMPLNALTAALSAAGIVYLAKNQKLKYNRESNPQTFSCLRKNLNTNISETKIWLEKCIEKSKEIELENNQKQALNNFIDSLEKFLDSLSMEKNR